MGTISKTITLKESLEVRIDYTCHYFPQTTLDDFIGFLGPRYNENVRVTFLKNGKSIGYCADYNLILGTEAPEIYKDIDRTADIVVLFLHTLENGRGVTRTLQITGSKYNAHDLKREAKLLMQTNRPQEICDLQAKEQEKWDIFKLEYAQEILACPNVFPDKKARNAWLKQYNDSMNQGEEGFLPPCVTEEERMWAKKIIEKNKNTAAVKE